MVVSMVFMKSGLVIELFISAPMLLILSTVLNAQRAPIPEGFRNSGIVRMVASSQYSLTGSVLRVKSSYAYPNDTSLVRILSLKRT